MTLSDLTSNLITILPITILLAWSVILLLVDVWISPGRKWLTAALAAVGLSLTLGASLSQAGHAVTGFNGMVEVDNFAVFLDVLFIGSGLFAIALAHDYLKRMQIERGEYYVLLLVTVAGMMLMSVATDLIVVFLSLELLSLPLYILSGFARPRPDSEESSLKYFLLGSFSGGVFLYGVALTFGATQTTSLRGVLEAVQNAVEAGGTPPLMIAGAALLLVGLGFKVSAVPFHMWTPDVYHGAPTPVTAFMAAGAKAAGFAALLRVLFIALPDLSDDLTPILWGLSALTMIAGNFLAVVQSNIKRMLAYSSIAHGGYLLIGLVIYGQAGMADSAVAASLFYLAAYAITNFGTWAVVIAMERAGAAPGLDAAGETQYSLRKGLQVEDYAGMGRKQPLLAAAMTVFMLSLTGIPPTLGFLGKFYIFRTLLQVDTLPFVLLAVIGVLTSLVSAYYYLRVVVVMYMRSGEPEVRDDAGLVLTAVTCALATIVVSLFSTPLFRWAAQAILRVSG